MLTSAGFDTPAAESVLVRSETRTVADPAFRSTVQSVLAKLRTMPQVTKLRTGAAGQISRPARAADPVRHEGKAGHRRRAGATAARRCRRPSEGEPWLHGRGVRLCERDARVEQDDRQGLPEGGEAVAADHLPDPADRLRRLRRRRRTGPARLLGGARIGRALGARQPRLPCLRCDPVGDPADGDGGRSRLLALLFEARARGACRRPSGA